MVFESIILLITEFKTHPYSCGFICTIKYLYSHKACTLVLDWLSNNLAAWVGFAKHLESVRSWWWVPCLTAFAQSLFSHHHLSNQPTTFSPQVCLHWEGKITRHLRLKASYIAWCDIRHKLDTCSPGDSCHRTTPVGELPLVKARKLRLLVYGCQCQEGGWKVCAQLWNVLYFSSGHFLFR